MSKFHLLERATRFTEKGRIVALECHFCGRKWATRGRGRATGFIVAAADSHARKCSAAQEARAKALYAETMVSP